MEKRKLKIRADVLRNLSDQEALRAKGGVTDYYCTADPGGCGYIDTSYGECHTVVPSVYGFPCGGGGGYQSLYSCVTTCGPEWC